MKRLIALVLTALLSISVLLPVYADAAPTISMESISAKAGDTVTLKLSVSGNPGVSALVLTLKYDSAVLTQTGVANGQLFESMESGLNLVFSSMSEVTSDGTLATVTFAVSGNASGSYPVRVIVREACNAAAEDVSFAAVDGTVNVSNDGVFSVRVNGVSQNVRPGDTLAISATPAYTERGLKYRFERWTATYTDGSAADIVAAPAEASTQALVPDRSVDINAQYYILGDVNGDKAINARDVQLIMKVLVGSVSSEGMFTRSDYNEDGRLNNRDVLMMLLDLVNGVIE